MVVDNWSDDSFDILSITFKNEKRVIAMRSDDDRGFAADNNTGIKNTQLNDVEYTMLLNNDTKIVLNMIYQLVLQTNKNTVTVPKMYYHVNKRKIWYAGRTINYFNGKITHNGENKYDREKLCAKQYVGFATGCCTLIPVETINKVGCLDENYFMYAEDADYSIRLIERNIRILFVPEVKLWLRICASGGTKSKMNVYYGNSNRLYLYNEFKFPISSYIFYYLTRFMFFVRDIIFGSNEKYILKAILD